jgi:deazaflavin-dependent oxidoreductase (nitroreductase family)
MTGAVPGRAAILWGRSTHAERSGLSAKVSRELTDALGPVPCNHQGMAKTYNLTRPRRVLNALMRILLRIGFAPADTYLLTVRGHRSGALHSTPVTLVVRDRRRWLVAPYGAVGWVRNVRAAGQIQLTRGRRSERVEVDEVRGEEAAGVLRTYLGNVRVVRPYFDAAPDSPLATFVAEASRHPVFRLRGQQDVGHRRPDATA